MRRNRTALTIGITLAASGLVGGVAFWGTNEFFINQAERNVKNLLHFHEAMHVYVQQVLHPAVYSLKSAGALPEELYAPELFSSSFMVREQHRLYNEVRREQGLLPIYYKMAADNPRNPVNRADEREEQLIEYFNTHVDQKRYREIVQLGGQRYLVVAVPFLRNNPACLRCHGNRADAPQQLQARYPGEGGFNEKVGHIRAIESIRVPIDTEARWAWVVSAMLIAGASVLGGLVLTNRTLAGRVRERTAHLETETAERRRAEDALLVTQFAVDTMSDAVYRIDDAGRILYANRGSVQQLGYSQEELLGGMTVKELSTRLTPELWRSVWQRIRDSGGYHTETSHRRKNGTSIPVDVDATYMHFGESEFAWIVVRDMTERERLQTQLLQAQKMEAIGTLAGGIAHDFNNILAAVHGYADLAHDALPEDSEEREDVRQILLASERARELVQHILAFSRKDRREKAPLQAGIVTEEALQLLRASLPVTIEIRQELNKDLWVQADPTGLHQIVMNLCTNAFQAMRETGGLLEVTLGVVPKGVALPVSLASDKNWALLRVRDSGPGIAPDALQRIFEPYFTTKRASGGTGLGLSVVHGLVTSYGGTITVSSGLGEGTTFEIWLMQVEPTNGTEPSPLGLTARGKGRIVLVDDEATIRTVCARQLRAMGYEIVAVTNADEVLELMRRQPDGFELLLTDQTMPKQTGLDLATEVRRICPAAKIVLMSGYSDAIQDRTPAQLGVDAVLAKPFTREQLGKVVREALTTSPHRRS